MPAFVHIMHYIMVYVKLKVVQSTLYNQHLLHCDMVLNYIATIISTYAIIEQ